MKPLDRATFFGGGREEESGREKEEEGGGGGGDVGETRIECPVLPEGGEG